MRSTSCSSNTCAPYSSLSAWLRMIFLTASWYSTGWWWKSSAVFTSGYLDTFCSSQDGVAGECLQIGDQVGEARLERPGGGAERGELESAVRLQQPLRRAWLREHERSEERRVGKEG